MSPVLRFCLLAERITLSHYLWVGLVCYGSASLSSSEIPVLFSPTVILSVWNDCCLHIWMCFRNQWLSQLSLMLKSLSSFDWILHLLIQLCGFVRMEEVSKYTTSYIDLWTTTTSAQTCSRFSSCPCFYLIGQWLLYLCVQVWCKKLTQALRVPGLVQLVSPVLAMVPPQWLWCVTLCSASVAAPNPHPASQQHIHCAKPRHHYQHWGPWLCRNMSIQTLTHTHLPNIILHNL